jgi:hypothetical protein
VVTPDNADRVAGTDATREHQNHNEYYVGVNAEATADELWRVVENQQGITLGTKPGNVEATNTHRIVCKTSSRGGGRTRTGVTSHWILSPERLPFRHSAKSPEDMVPRLSNSLKSQATATSALSR